MNTITFLILLKIAMNYSWIYHPKYTKTGSSRPSTPVHQQSFITAGRMKSMQVKFTRNFIIHPRHSNKSLPVSRNISPDATPKKSPKIVLESPKTDSVPRSASAGIFKPSRKVYVELAAAKNFFDLQGKSIQKDLSSLMSIASTKNYDDRTATLLKEYKKQVSKVVKKAKSDKEELHDCKFSNPYTHPKARIFFREIKRGNMKEIIQLLLEHPELVRAVDSTQQTALHWAVRRNNLELVQLLVISSKAFIYAKDITERTPVEIAEHLNLKEIQTFLRNYAQQKRTKGFSVIADREEIKVDEKNNEISRLISSIETTKTRSRILFRNGDSRERSPIKASIPIGENIEINSML
ncbi:unnamed protein product [Blepharisma stoltei]|uniref:Ankyrin repeat domain-containing protein n=1 Tax=Blepharisma stoltei TaxID=1481888 RepID=A0AAU9K213_9CILI|nr:unnamed protein product [Blepharisma stoltei]